MTRTSHKRRHKKSAGYTLLELMVALGTGALVILVAYGLAAASARNFQEQQKLASLQSSVRVAMDQLQRDVERAGYLAMPNSRTAPRCGEPPFHTQAIEYVAGTGDAIVDPAGENRTSAGTLNLVGSYATPDQFLVSNVGPAFDEVFLQTSWQGFQRNFMDSTGTAIDTAALQSVFTPGRMLMLRATTGNVFYATISGATVNGTQASVQFAPALPVGGPCLGGMAGGAVISVLSHIQYQVVDEADPSVAALLPLSASAASMGQDTQVLIRREVAFDAAAAPIVINNAIQSRIVLENAVEFDLQFTVFNTPNLQRVAAGAEAAWVANTTDNPAARPELVRSVLVALSARAAEQDPRYPWVVRGATDALSRYRLNPALPGAARVRSMHTEINLPNLR